MPLDHAPQETELIKLGSSSYDDMVMFNQVVEEALFRLPLHRDRALTYKTGRNSNHGPGWLLCGTEQDREHSETTRARAHIFPGLHQWYAWCRDRCQWHEQVRTEQSSWKVLEKFLKIFNARVLFQARKRNRGQVRHHSRRDGGMDPNRGVRGSTRASWWKSSKRRKRSNWSRRTRRCSSWCGSECDRHEIANCPYRSRATCTWPKTKVELRCELLVPGSVSRKHGQIPCENIQIRIHIPECWIYFFRVEKHMRFGSVKSANRRTGKIKVCKYYCCACSVN